MESWFSLEDTAQQLTCPRCLRQSWFPVESPNDATTAYRAADPFAESGAAHGAYPVVLTAAFLRDVLHGGRLTFAPSLDLYLDDGPEPDAETDFLALWQVPTAAGSSLPPRTTWVIGECKTGPEFREDDVGTIRRMAAKLGGHGVAVFSTMADTFADETLPRLQALATEGRADNWRLVVLPVAWKELRAPDEVIAGARAQRDLLGLAEILQRRHLGIDALL